MAEDVKSFGELKSTLIKAKVPEKAEAGEQPKSNRDGQFDVVVTVAGGGLSGQAGAVRHGIRQAGKAVATSA